MTDLRVTEFLFEPSGHLTVRTEPGFELLGKYLGSGLSGVEGVVYRRAREAVERGLLGRSEEYDDVVGDGFSLTVANDQTTIELSSNPDRVLVLPTQDMLAALDAYAAFMAQANA